MSQQNAALNIQNLQQRQHAANNKIIQYQTEHKSVSDQLDQLWAEIRATHGVNTLDELRALYAQKKQERDAAVQNAKNDLTNAESILQGIKDALDAQKQ